VAELKAGPLPVVGVVEQLTFTRHTRPVAEAVEQVRSFVMRYFLGTANYKTDSRFSLGSFRAPGSEAPAPGGWDFSQCFYKMRGSGEVGKFSPAESERLIDLRDLTDVYEWVVLKARLLNYKIELSPLTGTDITLSIPFSAVADDAEYAVISSDFVFDEVRPAPGVAARVGLGYALLPSPGKPGGVLRYGPGHFASGFQGWHFEVRDSGETLIASPFTVPRPTRLLDLGPDPVSVTFRLVDQLTGGAASRAMPTLKNGLDPVLSSLAALDSVTNGWAGQRMGLSVQGLERFLMEQHLLSVFRTFRGMAHLFHLVADWTVSPGELPEWILPPAERHEH
jgi:hypothetical protein